MSEPTQRFSGRVADYERYRERYDPAILLPRLRQWCAFTSNWCVADIGAGTGMLTDVFLSNGNPVVAVEPNTEMLRSLQTLHADNPKLRIIEATAEATTLHDHSVDLISVGRAFHWFHTQSAMSEFRRVLRPGGWVVIVAYGRSEKGREENRVLETLLSKFSADSTTGTRSRYSAYSNLEQYFPWAYHHEEIPGEMRLSWSELRGMTLSLSHTPLESDPRFPDFERTLHSLFHHYAEGGILTLTTRYWINVGQF